MIIEISLVIIAITQVLLIVSLCCVCFKVKNSVKSLHADVHKASLEAIKLLDNLNELVATDIRNISDETTHLISKIADLTSDLNNKSRSMNFLFKPLSFLSAGLRSIPFADQSEKKSSLPDALKWVSRGIFLIKSTKEFLKKNEK